MPVSGEASFATVVSGLDELILELGHDRSGVSRPDTAAGAAPEPPRGALAQLALSLKLKTRLEGDLATLARQLPGASAPRSRAARGTATSPKQTVAS